MGRRLTSGTGRARPGRRLAVFLAVYFAVTCLIAWRLVEVQVVSADEYRALAQRQTKREVALPPERGKMYDRDGTPLALSVPAAAVYADPQVLRDARLDPSFVAADLSGPLDVPMGELVADLSDDAGFVYLARQRPRAVGTEVTELRLPGVGVLEEPLRTYPAGSLAAQVVGFAGIDGNGLSGLELAYDDELTGVPGRLRLERAPGGVAISSAPREVQPAEPGRDLVLTLDARIQYTAERLLAEAVERYDARGASAVVLDAATGEVLAMASSPGYDPGRIAASEEYARRNRVVTDVFEPGSVAKAVTIAAAVDEGLVGPDDQFDVPSAIVSGGKRFTDAHEQPRETIDLREMMARSSNVGTIMIAEELGEERLYEYLGRFGFARPTGLGFPGESPGLMPGLGNWYATSLPTIAIGQGVSASLLQVAGVFQTIAADGERIEPTLVRGMRGPDGAVVEPPAPARHRVVSQRTAGAVAELLEAVVAEGTGRRAAVPGYAVAGKTGTAQKPSTTERGYEEGAYVASFAGFAPVEEPRLVVAVMVDEPQEEHYGGVVAAPVFAELMDFALRDLRVPPSEPAGRTGSRDVQPAEPADT